MSVDSSVARLIRAIIMKLKRFSRTAAHHSQLGDAPQGGYAKCRQESGALEESYQPGTAPTVTSGRWAYAAYVAALDREELAASAYRRLVERIQAT
jgi:hypothetical protein